MNVSNSYGKSPAFFDPNLSKSETYSDDSSLEKLALSMATTYTSEESRQDVEDVTSQVKKLIAQQLEQKNKEREKKVSNLSARLNAEMQKNESLLSEVDILTRDCVAEVLKTMVFEVALRSAEEERDQVKLENTNLKAEIADIADELNVSEMTNGRLGMENLALVNYVRGDLLKLAAATGAQDLLNMLNPSNLTELRSLVSQMKGLEATLKSLQEFDRPDPMRAHIIKVFNHLKNKIEVLQKESVIDQPKLGLVLDRLRQHLIRHQIRHLRKMMEECKQPQIQPISMDLKKDVEKLYGQVKKFIPKEEPAPVVEEQKAASWWVLGNL